MTATVSPPQPTTRPAARPRVAAGPKGMPFLGVLPEFLRNPTRLMVTAQRYSPDIARLKFGPYDSYLVIKPELVRHVLQDNIQNYCRGRIYERFKIMFGVGLLTLEGETWLFHRRVAQPHFHMASVQKLADGMADCTEAMFERWENKADSGEPLDIDIEMLRLSLRILGRSFLATDFDDKLYDYLKPYLRNVLEVTTQQQWFAPLIDLLPKGMSLPARPRTRQTLRVLEKLIYDMIARHRRGEGDPGDYIYTLFEARHKTTGAGLTDYEIYDEIRTLILAGYETVGNGAAWTLYALAKHPEIVRKLEAELDRELAGRTPSVEDIARLPYLQMVIDEALRLYPPIWAYPRDAINDDVIGDYHIPGGSMVLLSPYATHHSPQVWDNPEVYDPERWRPELAAGRHRFAHYPFGGGQRQCIGNRYAILQMQMVVAMVAQRYHLHLVPGYPVEFSTLNTLHPKNGIIVTLRRR